jgi:hypothetical protein
MKKIITVEKHKTYIRQKLEQLDAYETIYDALMFLARDTGCPEEVRIRALAEARKVVDSCVAMERDEEQVVEKEEVSDRILKMLG